MITPCIKICKMEGKYCVGCKRTTEEITNWTRYSDEKKCKIIEDCLARANFSSNKPMGDA